MSTTETVRPVLVSSVMQRHPITILESETIREAVDQMVENHISALPVVNADDLLVGILSVNDLLRRVQDAERALEDRSPIYENYFWVTELIRGTLGGDEVTSAMSCAPVTARPDDSLQHVALLMLKNQIHHLPILSLDKKVVGVISSIDFVRFVAQSS